jgi:hypothetical protein
VEGHEYVAARAEEQEVLLHDLNDVLAAVVAARCCCEKSNTGRGEAKQKRTAEQQRRLDQASSACSDSKIARYLCSPTASGAAAVMVVFNTKASAGAAIAALGPGQPPGCVVALCQGCCSFFKVMARGVFSGVASSSSSSSSSGHGDYSAVSGGEHNDDDHDDYIDGDHNDADDRMTRKKAHLPFQLRKGYVPQVMHETLAPERVRWEAIGGAAFNVSMSKHDKHSRIQHVVRSGEELCEMCWKTKD